MFHDLCLKRLDYAQTVDGQQTTSAILCALVALLTGGLVSSAGPHEVLVDGFTGRWLPPCEPVASDCGTQSRSNRPRRFRSSLPHKGTTMLLSLSATRTGLISPTHGSACQHHAMILADVGADAALCELTKRDP